MALNLYNMYTDNKLTRLQPSQWMNFPIYALCAVVMFSFPLILILAVVKYLEFQMWSYDFNERTIVETKGILNVTRTEIHYYRVKSIRIEEPLVMRILGLSNVYIKTSDPYQPELKLYAVPNGTQLRNQLRVDTDMRRKEEGVREYDLYNM